MAQAQDIAKQVGITPQSVYYRAALWRAKGHSPEEALRLAARGTPGAVAGLRDAYGAPEFAGITAASRESGLPINTLRHRVRQGLTLAEAVKLGRRPPGSPRLIPPKRTRKRAPR